MVHYASKARVGLSRVASLGDGYTINLQWFQAYPDVPTNQIAYHIYFAGIRERVFLEGVKYVIIDGSTETNVINLTPGQDYFFCVRPVEYDPTAFDLSQLPIAYNNVRFYPFSLLRSDIGPTDLLIPLMDVECFPPTGVVLAGAELILYLAVDYINNDLLVPGGTEPINAHLQLQSNDEYYLPASTNIGQGSISNLQLVGSDQNETWSIRCIFVQRDGSGNPIPSTAKFSAIGSISGNKVDGYGEYVTWEANGAVLSNGILSFSVTETSPPFIPGDNFIIQTVDAIPGLSSGRGYDNTIATEHTVDGYDGYNYYNPLISVITVGESLEYDNIYACTSRFEYPHFPFTILDGYRQVPVDYLSTDLTVADSVNTNFPMYDYAGWHRTDPVQLLNGTCVGSYIGGQMGCIDQYGNYNIYRGMSLEDQNTQRQDQLLSVTGQPVVLIKRVQTGVTCNCYLSTSEYPDDRCPFCYGTKFVFGYDQYFNPRRSDGRILVRVSPTAENLKMHEAGLESEFPADMWTLTVPTIKTRDILVLFDQADNESFRYEVSDVTRNTTILGLNGGQHMKTFRIRKTDPAYQIRIFRDTSEFPQTLNTTIGMALGAIPPHSHTIQVSEKILSLSQMNQTTGISQGHSHPIVNGVVQEVLSHTHQILLP
jgi:hypothetical protein